jgi:hypothetical protein
LADSRAAISPADGLTAAGAATAALPPLPFAFVAAFAAVLVVRATGLRAAALAIDRPEVFPAAWLEVFSEGFFETFFKGFFLATGRAARLDGDFFDERPDLAGAGFFLAGFFDAVFAFVRFGKCRFGARDLGVGRLRAGFERGFALRLAFVLDLGRDFFTGFRAFLAMVVLLLGRDSLASAPLFLDSSEIGATRENFKL